MAQSDYRKGYIIKNDWDTIYGYIDYNSFLFQTCKFKNNLKEELVNYNPYEIIGFRFKNDKYFLSKRVKVKNDYDLYGEVFITGSAPSRTDFEVIRTWYSDTNYYYENVFAEYLLKGEINIYFFIDNNYREHYLIEKSDSIYDLTKELFQTFHHGTIFATKDRKKYIGIIKYLMSDIPEMNNKIQNTQLNHKDLIEIGKDYQNYVCGDDNCIIYAKSLQKINLNFGFYMGLGYSQLSDLSTNAEYYPLFKDKNSVHIGSFLHLRQISPKFEKLSFKLTIDYCSNNYKSNFMTYLYGETNLEVSFNNLLLSLQLVNNMTTNIISPFYEIGFDALFSFNESFIEDNYYQGRIREETFLSGRVGINLGLGTEISLFDRKNQLLIELVHHQMIGLFSTNLIIGYEF